MTTTFHLLLVVVCLTFGHLSFAQKYFNGDQAEFLSDWPQIIANSYSTPVPSSMSACVNSPSLGTGNLTEVFITTNMNAAKFQSTCGSSNLCVVNPGVTVTLDGNVNVAAIINRGTMNWFDSTQKQPFQFLCAGYLVTEANGVFNLTVTGVGKSSFIYLKNNGAEHPLVGIRAFGGSQPGATLTGYPIVEVTGSPLARTWSVLARTVQSGNNTLRLLHNINDMGWSVGDRIAIAPTTNQATGEAQTFFIKSIQDTYLTLATDSTLATPAYTNQEYLGEGYMQAEVMVLSRSIVITGDDFQHVPCGSSSCPCRSVPGIDSLTCTIGLHTMMNGNDVRHGGTFRVQYTRVEKCGHRAAIGRYCLHFHLMRDCPNCLFNGNAVEYSMQRGIVVHGTHMAWVTQNTLYDVRGGGIYVEDGNELYNHIEYNAVICPHAYAGPLGGCTIPGTDNLDADSATNQASFWSLSQTNHYIGNRAANSYNGIFFDPSFMNTGRGFALGEVCVEFTPLGRVQGNTCHSHSRFGQYFVSSNWPKQLNTSLLENGYTIYPDTNCSGFDALGNDRGAPATIWNGVDYFTAFVGGYQFGDVQWVNHTSISNGDLHYHKESKDFADGCAPHFINTLFEDGIVALPGGHGSVIFQDVTFRGNTYFESGHACGVGISGVLCNGQYIFENPTWQVTSEAWLTFNDINNPTHGSVYNLAPPDAANPKSTMFPPGFQGVAHGAHTYLLNIDNKGTCVTAASLGLATRYENGILCKKPLRRFEIYTSNINSGAEPTVTVNVYYNNQLTSSGPMYWTASPGDPMRKQGYTIPIIASLDYSYEITSSSGSIPAGWIIEFSDPVMGNRYGVEQIKLSVQGRTCPAITTSQHDRRFIYSSDYVGFSVPGRGACTTWPDMPTVNCKAQGDIQLMNCPSLCKNCNGANQYCDCGSGLCLCTPGFSGDGCTQDICASSRCGPHGHCSARFMGGNLPVVADPACVCDLPWMGPTCESNPCQGQTCSGNGYCVPLSETTSYCECLSGYTGATCNSTCNGICTGNGGVYPYYCSDTEDSASFCNNGGACMYDDSVWGQPGWCCFAHCSKCYGVECASSENECMQPSICVNGACVPSPGHQPNGTVCFSELWGTCHNGACVGGVPPPPNQPKKSTATHQYSVSYLVILLLILVTTLCL